MAKTFVIEIDVEIVFKILLRQLCSPFEHLCYAPPLNIMRYTNYVISEISTSLKVRQISSKPIFNVSSLLI